ESTSRVFIDPAPTHFELAASISTHREAVSRVRANLSCSISQDHVRRLFRDYEDGRLDVSG
ncbi:hypothetical protein BMJ27_08540, partial [Sinorhizobium medicae]